MMEDKVYGNVTLLFTELDNDQTKEKGKEENQIPQCISSDALQPYKD